MVREDGKRNFALVEGTEETSVSWGDSGRVFVNTDMLTTDVVSSEMGV